jgi:hypothetical protein
LQLRITIQPSLPFLGAFAYTRSRKNSLLIPSCPSVHLSVCINSAPTGRILVKFHIIGFYKSCREYPNWFEIGQKFLALCMKTSLRLYSCQQIEIFSSFTIMRRKSFVEFRWKQSTVLLLTTILVAENIQWGFLLNFHGNGVYANAFYCPL